MFDYLRIFCKDFYYNFVITTQMYKFGAETHLGGRVMTALSSHRPSVRFDFHCQYS